MRRETLSFSLSDDRQQRIVDIRLAVGRELKQARSLMEGSFALANLPSDEHWRSWLAAELQMTPAEADALIAESDA